MTKLGSLLLVLVLVLVAAVATRSVQAEGALVIRQVGCGLMDGEGNVVSPVIFQAVVTPNGYGKLTCRAEGVTPPPDGSTRIFSHENTGLPCGTSAGTTNHWQNVVTPGGISILSCQVHPS